jgi:hypothetical protein
LLPAVAVFVEAAREQPSRGAALVRVPARLQRGNLGFGCQGRQSVAPLKAREDFQQLAAGESECDRTAEPLVGVLVR